MVLPGCESLQLFKSAAVDKGAAVVDTLRDDAEFTLCKGITVGSWQRRFGDSAEAANAWRTLCSVQIKQAPTAR